jgi:hypothetical protein
MPKETLGPMAEELVTFVSAPYALTELDIKLLSPISNEVLITGFGYQIGGSS